MIKRTIALLTFIAASSTATFGETVVTGGLVVNETWTLGGSPYWIQGDIQVSLLTIEPGVEVQVDPGFTIDVLSSISAVGTESQPVVFMRRDAGSAWGGILFQNNQSPCLLEHCRIEGSDNSGLRIIESNPAIKSCLFTQNHASGGGGAMYIDSTTVDVLIEDSVFLENTSNSHGGAIRSLMGTDKNLSFERCFFESNTGNADQSNGNYHGGAIYHTSGALNLSGCELLENEIFSKCSNWCCTVYAYGGGISIAGGDLNINNCFFGGNRATAIDNAPGGCEHNYGRGAGIFMNSSGNLQATNTVFACNDGYSGGTNPHAQGCGLYVAAGSSSLVNCTLARNISQGIYRSGGTVDVRNSILFFNNNDGNQVVGDVSIEYSDVQGGALGLGNINANPVFTGPGCDLCEYRLVMGSPCIDAGDPDPAHDDACMPPGLGQPGSLDPRRSDMGAFGGAENCSWGTGTTTNYCSANVNSTGFPARISHLGSTSIADNAATLRATPVPNDWGVFYFGTCTSEAPFGDGIRCVGGSVTRIKPVVPGIGGVASLTLDLTREPIGPGSYFLQYWFRDLGNFNLSDGIEVSFLP